MLVNNEYFRPISQNSKYFCTFKNPRNTSEIRTLAQQVTQGNLGLIKFYKEATIGVFKARRQGGAEASLPTNLL